MKKLLLLVTLMAACGSARETGMKELGEGTRCVAATDKLAYCVVGGLGYICDRSGCVPAPSPEQAILELDADRQRQDDEDDNTYNTTMRMSQ